MTDAVNLCYRHAWIEEREDGSLLPELFWCKRNPGRHMLRNRRHRFIRVEIVRVPEPRKKARGR